MLCSPHLLSSLVYAILPVSESAESAEAAAAAAAAVVASTWELVMAS